MHGGIWDLDPQECGEVATLGDDNESGGVKESQTDDE